MNEWKKGLQIIVDENNTEDMAKGGKKSPYTAFPASIKRTGAKPGGCKTCGGKVK